MLNCEICYGHTRLLFTKCCKAIVCSSCSERPDKKSNCLCGRPFPQGPKNYADCPELLTLLQRHQQGKTQECDRCDRLSEVECRDCEMLFCQICNSQVHAAMGFAKHVRKQVTTGDPWLQARKKEVLCLQHSQPINSGCECGSGLCSQCLKSHKESCPRFRLKMLREFKEEYGLNLLVKLRQLSFYKERLCEDKLKYEENFKEQEQCYLKSEEAVGEQFELLRKMVQLKEREVRNKMEHYWKQCQKVYQHSLQKIDKQIEKYDQYAELLQVFNASLANLDFFDKKIKKYPVPVPSLHLKTTNFENTHNAIMNISLQDKPWEQQTNDPNLELPKESAPPSRDDLKAMTSLQNTSQLILDYNDNPLQDRQLTLLPSHSEILYNFIHLPYQNLNYQVEYGVGMKIKGQEIFKRVPNHNGYGVIEGLNPNTKYRVRMRVAEGTWGPVAEVTTLDVPKFNLASSSFAKSMAENTVQLGKGGIVYGSNEIHFGVHRWVIKLTSKTISYEDSETACLSVGVSNKEAKKAVFVGSTLNYGFQKSEIVLRILLDLNEKRLVIGNCSTGKEEVYQNLPNCPLLPTIQNKGNGQILVRYNLVSDDANSL